MKKKKNRIWSFIGLVGISLLLSCLLTGCQQQAELIKAQGIPMTITLTQSPESKVWTREKAVIKIDSSTSIKAAKWVKGVRSVKEIFASGTEIKEDAFEVNGNGVYSVAVLDNEGRREVETIEVKNIDKRPPPCPFKFAAEYKLNERKIILRWLEPADLGSGLKELYLKYTVNGQDGNAATIKKGLGRFELNNIEPQSPPHAYIFCLKAVDLARNESEEVKASVTPSEKAEVTGLEISRKKIHIDDPDKKIILTLTGSNLTLAGEINIITWEAEKAACKNFTDSEARTEFTLPNEVNNYTFRVSVKHTESSSALFVAGLEAETQVCGPCTVTKMTVTKQDGTLFKTDSSGSFIIDSGETGEMKIILEGENFDIEGLRCGINFNGTDFDGISSNDGTKLCIENILLPNAAGNYPIKAQFKNPYEEAYTQVPDSKSKLGYKSKQLRVLGEIVLNELRLSGYDPDHEENTGWLIIKGENLDQLNENELANIHSYLGAEITEPRIKDSFTIEAVYTFPELQDDNLIDKSETINLAGKTVSCTLHTLKIEKDKLGKYVVQEFYSILPEGIPYFPDYINIIGKNAFKDCDKIRIIDLSSCSELTIIDKEAFKACKNLVSVIFPKNLKEIKSSANKGAFQGCTKLQEVDLSACLEFTVIGNGVFKGCKELTSIKFPSSLEKIGQDAFKGCKKLTCAVFLNTENWAVYDKPQYKTKLADIDANILSDSAKAAEYLKNTHCGKYWKRN